MTWILASGLDESQDLERRLTHLCDQLEPRADALRDLAGQGYELGRRHRQRTRARSHRRKRARSIDARPARGEPGDVWKRGRGRDGATRVAFVDRYAFPDVVAERFRREHPELHPEDTSLVEAAARQWFRLLSREPGRRLALPSRAVSEWWLAFVHAEAAYGEFCRDAFGEFVPHRPPPSGPGEGVADGAGLQRTLKSARRDETGPTQALPFLFTVDARVQVLNARRYVEACGGGPECYPVAGSVCLHHLAGLDRPLRRTHDPRHDQPAARLKPTPPKI